MIKKFKMFLESKGDDEVIEITNQEFSDAIQNGVIIPESLCDEVIAVFSEYSACRLSGTSTRVGSRLSSFINETDDMLLLCVDDDYWAYLMYVISITSSSAVQYSYKIDIGDGFDSVKKASVIINEIINEIND